MTIENELGDLIENITPKFAFILENGTIIKSTIAEENLLEFIEILPKLKLKLSNNSFIHLAKLYVYRLTIQFFILILTDLEEGVIKNLLDDINERFVLKINKKFSGSPKTFKSIVKTIVFSMSRSSGPEPIAWRAHDFKENDIYTVCMKTMLTLTGELEGAKKKILAFIPFIRYDALGIIFLFHIPFKHARGGAFDSSITILANYSDRAIIYEKNEELELILDEISYLLDKKYNEHSDTQGNISTNKIFDHLLEGLENALDNIPLNIASKEVRKEMLISIKKLKEF